MSPLAGPTLLALLAACAPTVGEGRSAAECDDGVDNDDDGKMDCDDLGCSGYDMCGGGDDTSDGGDDTGSPLPDLVEDPELVLNEFMASNASAWEDPDVAGTFPDWIELYNLTTAAIELDGYTITDDFALPRKHVLAGGLVLPAGGWIILVADRDVKEGSDHLPFALARAGESLAVYRPDGIALDALRYTVQTVDNSLARKPDGVDYWDTDATSTPGAANGEPD